MTKRIAVFCDGTWNKPDQEEDGKTCPTNVARLHAAVALKDSGGMEQRALYLPGVGTGLFDRIRGGFFGWGLSEKVKDAYRFLIECYDPGDELFLFGFSRGAYTARSTVGLIRNSGLLKREFANQLDAAYRLYRRRDDAAHPSSAESERFRKSYSHEPRVKFIGVWDTVGALGIPLDAFRILNYPWRFHDVRLSRRVDHAFQAIAIDERRRPFKPTIWEQHEEAQGQVLEQVWFSGAHSNVGGGYAETGLSDIALLWMAGKAGGCGLAFEQERLLATVHPNPLGKIRDSQTWFYRLLGDYLRPIGKLKNSRESAASTAILRQEKLDQQTMLARAYDPRNLRSFRAGGGPVTEVSAGAIVLPTRAEAAKVPERG
jgi:uncharacterized protein (DUF2235 family)